jgi:hypothetical protein
VDDGPTLLGVAASDAQEARHAQQALLDCGSATVFILAPGEDLLPS